MIHTCPVGVPGLQDQLLTIAEPNRFRIVGLLGRGPRPVGEIVAALEIGQPQVSRHLRILKEAGLVAVHKRGQQRIYSLQPLPFEGISEWLESFSHVWAGRMDALDAYLEEDLRGTETSDAALDEALDQARRRRR
jgi:DNA-binding transcriptional ArsR family regulator